MELIYQGLVQLLEIRGVKLKMEFRRLLMIACMGLFLIGLLGGVYAEECVRIEPIPPARGVDCAHGGSFSEGEYFIDKSWFEQKAQSGVVNSLEEGYVLGALGFEYSPDLITYHNEEYCFRLSYEECGDLEFSLQENNLAVLSGNLFDFLHECTLQENLPPGIEFEVNSVLLWGYEDGDPDFKVHIYDNPECKESIPASIGLLIEEEQPKFEKDFIDYDKYTVPQKFYSAKEADGGDKVLLEDQDDDGSVLSGVVGTIYDDYLCEVSFLKDEEKGLEASKISSGSIKMVIEHRGAVEWIASEDQPTFNFKECEEKGLEGAEGVVCEYSFDYLKKGDEIKCVVTDIKEFKVEKDKQDSIPLFVAEKQIIFVKHPEDKSSIGKRVEGQKKYLEIWSEVGDVVLSDFEDEEYEVKSNTIIKYIEIEAEAPRHGGFFEHIDKEEQQKEAFTALGIYAKKLRQSSSEEEIKEAKLNVIKEISDVGQMELADYWLILSWMRKNNIEWDPMEKEAPVILVPKEKAVPKKIALGAFDGGFGVFGDMSKAPEEDISYLRGVYSRFKSLWANLGPPKKNAFIILEHPKPTDAAILLMRQYGHWYGFCDIIDGDYFGIQGFQYAAGCLNELNNVNGLGANPVQHRTAIYSTLNQRNDQDSPNHLAGDFASALGETTSTAKVIVDGKERDKPNLPMNLKAFIYDQFKSKQGGEYEACPLRDANNKYGTC
jgi:hypothetical protein